MLILNGRVLSHLQGILETFQNAFQMPGGDFGAAHVELDELRSV